MNGEWGVVSCCLFNLYMQHGQEARTTIILRFRVTQFSYTSATPEFLPYSLFPIP